MSHTPEDIEAEAKMTEEEKEEDDRVRQLSEELAAEAREVFNHKGKVFNMQRKRVTDYKRNSRVILPRAQTIDQESKLEVLRVELLEEHKKWVAQNCNHEGNQLMNISEEELKGLKSLKARIKSGELVVLPTDKSGRFCVMSMQTYILAGETHIDGDEEIGLSQLKKNQRKINGHVSMLLKFFNTGSDWNHQQRLRESMLSDSLAVCPLWLLFKCHKGWTWKTGKPPPPALWQGGTKA